MELETLIVIIFCLVEDFVRDLCRGCRPRQRGPAPVLAHSEGLTSINAHVGGCASKRNMIDRSADLECMKKFTQ